MHVKPTAIPGCFEIQADLHTDDRGLFVKTMHRNEFVKYGMECDFVEQYYTVSRPGVIRGLHFQLPPHAHAKLVYCIAGSVIDAVIDLRAGSPTYHKCLTLDLNAEKGNMIYVPRGLAHGFCAREKSVMVYNVTSAYAPQHDAGLLWNSAGIDWPVKSPILSERDRGFPVLDIFHSPFRFDRVQP
jgi:dTDP-4-dehydrorhamnose 3,5-epimerase